MGYSAAYRRSALSAASLLGNTLSGFPQVYDSASYTEGAVKVYAMELDGNHVAIVEVLERSREMGKPRCLVGYLDNTDCRLGRKGVVSEVVNETRGALCSHLFGCSPEM